MAVNIFYTPANISHNLRCLALGNIMLAQRPLQAA